MTAIDVRISDLIEPGVSLARGDAGCMAR